MKTLLQLVDHLCNGTPLTGSLSRFAEHEEFASFVLQLKVTDEALSKVCQDAPQPNKNESAAADDLYPDQKGAVEALRTWLASEGSPFFVIKGYAGSGKTTLLKYLKKVFTEFTTVSTVLYATPTHKAANVLASAADVPVSTLASLLGVKVSDESEELTYIMPDELPNIPRNALLVVDESSQVSKDYLEFLVKVAESYCIRIIFFGDPAQLPPVGEHRSPVWKFVEKDCSYSLVSVKRHGGDILDLATEVRQRVFDKELRGAALFKRTPSSTITLCADLGNYSSAALDELRSGNAKIVSWRNSVVDAHANRVRDLLGFTKEFDVGELYNLRRPALSVYGAEVGVAEDEVLIEERDEDAAFEIEGFRIPSLLLRVSGPFSTTIRAILPDNECLLEEALSKLARRARNAKGYERKAHWRTFWKTKNTFATMKSAYSITAHRAQGSQCSHVYVDATDILSNPRKSEACRCLYVAVTRATERLTIRS